MPTRQECGERDPVLWIRDREGVKRRQEEIVKAQHAYNGSNQGQKPPLPRSLRKTATSSVPRATAISLMWIRSRAQIAVTAAVPSIPAP